MNKKLLVLDCEVYKNYFLVAFKNLESGKTRTIECKGENSRLSEKQREILIKTMSNYMTFGFNSRNYDMMVILYSISGASCYHIYKMSKDIIENNKYGWQTLQKYDLSKPNHWSHFDIQEPSPGVKVSLKLYGGRIHSKTLKDLPYDPESILTDSEMKETKLYCINDLDTTIDLYNNIKGRIDLRIDMSKDYDFSIVSKSDAQLAEMVIKSQLEKKMGHKIKAPGLKVGETFRYRKPDFISFKTKEMQKSLDVITSYDFELDKKGSIQLPKEIKDLKIKLGFSTYQLGIGGIHTNENPNLLFRI